MRTIAVLITVCLSFAANAQKLSEKHISFSGKEALSMNIQIADSINITTWKKEEVSVRASVNINDNTDNDAYEISYPEFGKTVEIKANFKKDYFKGRDNINSRSEIYWEVIIPEKTPFSVETINGNITIKGVTDEMSIKTISGFIDLSEPSEVRADLQISTITGTVFTNHEFGGEKREGGILTKIRKDLNDGGYPIKLETISGDIFLRKSD